ARLKIFFDRFSDLLHAEKEIGRKLRGMEMAVISCASERNTKEGFHMSFKESAKYLGMNYVGDVHGWVEDKALSNDVQKSLDEFCKALN
ncbi:MAG: FMN reductase, partial [Bacteroidia bacterium]|nr:FMN reductase [Bacteroidia bacterium]